MKNGEVNLKDLKYIAKKIVKKPIIKKIESVKDKREQMILYEYVIRPAIEFKIVSLREKVKEMEKSGRDMFFISSKLQLLSSKIHFFNATLYKKDFQNIMKGFKEIEKEINR